MKFGICDLVTHFEFIELWVRPEFAHGAILELVSGASFGSVPGPRVGGPSLLHRGGCSGKEIRVRF